MRPCLSWSCTATSPGLGSGPSKVPVPPPEAHLGLTHPCPTLPNTGTCGLSSQEPSNSPVSGRVSSPAAPRPSVHWMKITCRLARHRWWVPGGQTPGLCPQLMAQSRGHEMMDEMREPASGHGGCGRVETWPLQQSNSEVLSRATFHLSHS